MWLNKLLKSNKVNIDSLIDSILKIRKKKDLINLCAAPTGYSWLGVYNAGLSLFPENTLAIPQYYSNQVLTEKQLQEIGTLIGELKFEQLIYNGYNSYFSIISNYALKINPNLKIGVIYHGFFAELSGNAIQVKIMNAMIEDVKAKRLHKIGFLKKGNAEIFEKKFDIPCSLLFNKNPEPFVNITTKPIIGVLTNQSFRKNSSTQVIAALCLTDYSVSIFDSKEYDSFDTENRLIKNQHLSHGDFLLKLAENTINSHVTFSEASGGQVFTESLAVGVPCITSLTHGYLDDSEELKKALVVDRFDDAWAIAQKMEEVLENRDHLSKLGLVYSNEMNKKVDFLLDNFLES
jgi:glycosyltransferase involved in cell wall biosynthesis